MPQRRASPSSAGQCDGGAPNLLDRRHWLPLSSVMIRRMSWILRLTAASLRTSAALSNVIRRTPRQTASMTWPRALVGLAYTMSGGAGRPWSARDAATRWTSAISAREAQSKWQPRLMSVRTMAGSGLHLTA